MSKTYTNTLKFTIALFSIITTLMIFILPFYIPPFKKNVSFSYDYQFNNLVAVILLYLSLLIALIYSLRYYKYQLLKNNIDGLFDSIASNKFQIKNYYIISGIFLCIVFCFYILGADYGYGEANYFLLRIDKINLGQLPYKDFEYAYGALLLYFPVLICKAFSLPTVEAYYLSYAIFNCVGLYFLYYVLDSFNTNIKTKRIAFYAIAIACVPFNLGVNYTLFRFITPFACILFINFILKKELKKNIIYVVTVGIAAITVVIFNFLISIEIGIALLIALASYFYISFLLNRNILNLLIALIYTSVFVILFFLFNNNFILILKVFASGGNNFPIIPAASVLFFILSYLIINIIFSASVFTGKVSFVVCSLVVFNIVILPGAFGRCDPGHLFWYGLNTFICLWMYLSYTNNRVSKIYSWTFILIFTIGANLSMLFLYKGNIGISILKFVASHEVVRHNLKKIAFYNKRIDNYVARYEAIKDFKTIDKYKCIAIPFDVDEDLYLHILRNKSYSSEYYSGLFLNVYTPEQIEAKLNNLKDLKHEYMIIPSLIFDYRADHQTSNDNAFMSILFFFPFNYTKEEYSQEMYQPIYSYIKRHYILIQKLDRGYYFVKRVKG